MGKVFTKQPANAGFQVNNSIDTNMDNLETATDRLLSRYADAPNQMESNLDMNDNNILNAGSVGCDSLTIAGAAVPSLSDVQAAQTASEAAQALAEAAQTAAEAAEANAEIAQAAAEAAVASVDLPIFGGADGQKVLAMNSASDSYELGPVYSNTVGNSSIVQRTPTGTIEASDPVEDYEVTTKSYVDTAISDIHTASSEPSGFTKLTTTYHANDLLAGSFLLSTNIAISTAETVGRTGSGADNEWADLDVIPTDAKALLIRPQMSMWDSGGAGVELARTYLGKDASSLKSYDYRSYQGGSAGTNALNFLSPVVVLLDSGTFTTQWNCSADNYSIVLYLDGYII